MASKGGKEEHRMLFDIRGRRKNVVKVVYAVLATLMGLSLFLTVGPVNIGEIFGNESGGSSETASRLEDEAARIEGKLAKEPENEELMVRLVRNHITAASVLSERGPNQEVVLTVDSREQYEQASARWSEYLEATDEPQAGLTQQMAGTLFQLAETSRSYSEAENNVKAAAEAQQIAAELRPSLGSLSTAALYTLYTFDYAKAGQLLDEAKKETNTKPEREQLDSQFKENEKRAKEFQKEFNEVQKLEEQNRGTGKQGAQESLQNPLGLGSGLGG